MTDKELKIEKLLSFIPYFENLDPEKACRWKVKKIEEGVFTLPYPVYDYKIKEFVDAFYESGLMHSDYIGGLKRRMPDWGEPGLNEKIRAADLDLLRIIFSMIVRSERFCNGALGDAAKEGTFLCILQRLKELNDAGLIPCKDKGGM